MQLIIKRIIAPIQATFIPDWWIHKNGLLAQELIVIVRKKKGKASLVGIKLDMSKAYD